tara:strand:- start:181 stop:528 length:348 start_codon:yes stop_codon:yes gene_type:complete
MALNGQNHQKLLKLLQVSRETIRSLNVYERLLLKNNRKLNLISKSTENIIKTRHILDCAQVVDFIDENSKTCADLGTGADFQELFYQYCLGKENLQLEWIYTKKVQKNASSYLKL